MGNNTTDTGLQSIECKFHFCYFEWVNLYRLTMISLFGFTFFHNHGNNTHRMYIASICQVYENSVNTPKLKLHYYCVVTNPSFSSIISWEHTHTLLMISARGLVTRLGDTHWELPETLVKTHMKKRGWRVKNGSSFRVFQPPQIIISVVYIHCVLWLRLFDS